MVKGRQLLFVAFLIVLGALGALNLSSAKDDPGPNVILISVDTLRADHLEPYGAKDVKTPNIARLAGEGALFLNHFGQGSWTRPTFGAIMTSLYPSQHGIQSNHLSKTGGKLAPGAVTMAQILRENGYYTAAINNNGHAGPAVGQDRGFDEFQAPADVMRSANTAYPVVRKWFAENVTRGKFFFWVNFMDPHTPFIPPAEYTKGLVDPNYAGPFKDGLTNDHMREIIRPHPERVTEADKEYARGLYKGEVQFIDEYIGVFLDDLKKMGLYEQSIIILVGDHGEELWEHEHKAAKVKGLYPWSFAHTHALYDEIIKVPLIIRAPQPRHQVVTTIARQIDILPTLLDLLGIKHAAQKKFEGVSLVPEMKGRSARRNRPAFSESIGNGPEKKSIRTDAYKLIYHPEANQVELYDLKKDPKEQKEIAAEEPAVVKQLLGELQAWMKRMNKPL